jgi:hypothetical protein
MQEYVANADSNIWKSYKKEIEGREKKLAAERAVKTREKKAKRKARVKKRNAHKREVLARREERERRMGNATARRLSGPQIEDVGSLGEGTDNESISTLCDTDEDTNDDSNYIRSDTSWTNTRLRYMAMMRVPWLNRRSRRD